MDGDVLEVGMGWGRNLDYGHNGVGYGLVVDELDVTKSYN